MTLLVPVSSFYHRLRLRRLWMGCVHPTSSECSPPSNSRDSSTSPGEESVYSQIRPPALPHTCHHGNTDLKERRVEEDFDNRQTGRTNFVTSPLKTARFLKRLGADIETKIHSRSPLPSSQPDRALRPISEFKILGPETRCQPWQATCSQERFSLRQARFDLFNVEINPELLRQARTWPYLPPSCPALRPTRCRTNK